MSTDRKFDFLDLLVLTTKYKKVLILQFLCFFILSYLLIFFLVDEKWDSTALIVPAEQSGLGGLASLLGGFGDLPIDIGNIESNPSIAMYETILYSRTFAVEMLDKFKLREEYNQNTLDENIKAFFDNLSSEETDGGAYSITIRGSSPEKAAKMVNYALDYLNRKIINLNIEKSKNNRVFLEKRFGEINQKLFASEEALSDYQKNSGIYVAEDQIAATINSYSSIVADLAKNEIESEVNRKLFGNNDVMTKNAKILVEETKKKLEKFKTGQANSSVILPLEDLPDEAKEYFRLFRDVKIYNSMLEFIIPLLEQARFEEQKDVPILQVVDYGAASEKRAYPKRTISALVITILIEFLVILTFYFYNRIKNSKNEKVKFIKENLFSFSNKVE